MSILRALPGLLVTLAGTALAHADNWIVGEVPAAVAVGGVQEQVFRPGMMPAFGVYHETPNFAAGLRMRLGALGNGPPPGNGMADPGMGGLGTVGVAVRVGLRAAWIEGVAGAGVTGHDVVPALEVGAGWTFQLASVDVGPSVRLLHVSASSAMDAIGSANLVLAGVDVRVGRARPPRVVHVAYVAPKPPAPLPPPEIATDTDPIPDADVGCAVDAEGCPVAGDLVMINDRIVLDERVLFDLDRARVRSAGRELVAALARSWHAHPEWKRITVEGHADVRGTDAYNQDLSQRRAENVKAQLVLGGFSPDRIDAVGYGRSRPRDPGSTEAAHSRNRRVEFVIDREDAAPSGSALSPVAPLEVRP